MGAESAMIMVNFVCIIILYGAVIYIIGEQTKIRDDMADFRDYQSTNERQLTNLIRDVNENDRMLQERISRII